jgi:hypothetical protein
MKGDKKVIDALNKVLIKEFAEYPRWWEPIVDIQDFTTLQTVRWMSLGGIGELRTVAEGSAYTELTWDDQTESSIFVKKGVRASAAARVARLARNVRFRTDTTQFSADIASKRCNTPCQRSPRKS